MRKRLRRMRPHAEGREFESYIIQLFLYHNNDYFIFYKLYPSGGKAKHLDDARGLYLNAMGELLSECFKDLEYQVKSSALNRFALNHQTFRQLLELCKIFAEIILKIISILSTIR